jgi:lipopolysaccharide transport system permease protein
MSTAAARKHTTLEAALGATRRPVTVIRPTKGWVAPGLRDLWTYRELLYFLVWRDIKVRYKQTVLGVVWAVLQPLLTMLIFTVVFGRFAKVPSDGVPYPIFAFCALLPWQLFAFALSESGNSLVNSQHLLKKVYFPRLIVPIAPVLAGLVDFSVSFVLLLVLMAYWGVRPGLASLTLPFFLLLAIATALGVGLWLSALNVEYRDVRYTIPFLTQFWLFATPIAYPSSLVPAKWRVMYGLNPMAGVVEGFRWALLGTHTAPGPMLLVSTLVVVALLVSGLMYFRRVEKTFVDVV